MTPPTRLPSPAETQTACTPQELLCDDVYIERHMRTPPRYLSIL